MNISSYLSKVCLVILKRRHHTGWKRLYGRPCLLVYFGETLKSSHDSGQNMYNHVGKILFAPAGKLLYSVWQIPLNVEIVKRITGICRPEQKGFAGWITRIFQLDLIFVPRIMATKTVTESQRQNHQTISFNQICFKVESPFERL